MREKIINQIRTTLAEHYGGIYWIRGSKNTPTHQNIPLGKNPLPVLGLHIQTSCNLQRQTLLTRNLEKPFSGK